MVGVRSKTKTGSQRYMCKTYSDKGRSVCNCNSIAEDILLDCLIRKIEELYLSDDAIERLRIAIRDQLQEERPPVVDLVALRKKLSDVEKQIAVGSERVFTAPDSVVESLYTRLDDLQKTKKRLKAQIEAAKSPASNDCATLDATVKEAIALLKDLRTTIRKAEPEHLTDLMQSLVSRVELQFNHRPYGKLTRSEFKRGTVLMRPGVPDSQLSQKGALSARSSTEDFIHHAARSPIGQTLFSSVVTKRQCFVIETKYME